VRAAKKAPLFWGRRKRERFGKTARAPNKKRAAAGAKRVASLQGGNDI